MKSKATQSQYTASDKESPIIFNLASAKGFEMIYKKYYRKMFNVAYGILGNIPHSESIVHDVFLSIWERRNQITVQQSMEGYLVGATKLAVLTHIRNTNNSRKHLKLIKDKSELTENKVDQDYEAQELQEKLDALVVELPEKCRNVYHLSRVKGKNNREISKELSISEKTVEAHISKALRHLRRHLKQIGFLFF
ncbi:MAG: RNA polymerase sigma-70 factor [Bacteroidota bacterium]